MGLATGLAIFPTKKWQVPSKKGKSHGTCPLLNKKMASPMGLANIRTKNGKSHGTCHFPKEKMASPMGLAISEFESGKSRGTCHFSNEKMASPMGLANIINQKWQVPWDLPFS